MAEFQTVAKTSEVVPGDLRLVELDGEEVVIANVGGDYFAFSNKCTHEGGPLADGELDGHVDGMLAFDGVGADFV